MKRLLDFDKFTGMQTFHEYDSSEDRTIITRTSDVEPLLKQNTEQFNDIAAMEKGFKAGWVKVGSIDAATQVKLKQELGIDIYNKDHLPAVLKVLHDRDWRKLKTANAKFI